MDIRLENIGKIYPLNNEIVFQDLSCYFKAGSFVTITGQSGSGKSTFLRILGGLDLNFSGDIYFNDQAIKTYKHEEQEIIVSNLRKQKIGYVFQEYKLLKNFTVYENLNIVLSLNRIPEGERKLKIDEVLSLVDMVSQQHKYPEQLSGGQKQRIAIARAMLKDLEVLIADEPTGALDDNTAESIMSIFERFHQKGITVILATHMKQFFHRGKRKFLLEKGELIEY